MNKGQKVVAGLLRLVAVELAVLDYAAVELLRKGVVIEVSQDELVEAGEKAMEDMSDESN